MWFTVKISAYGYLWLFALLRLGCGQGIFNNRQETGANTLTPQSSSVSYLPPPRVAARLLNQSCSAPPQPDNGEWRLHPDLCEKDSADCKVPKGTKLGLGYQLTYNCSSGYKIQGDDKVYCTANGKWSSIPLCIEIQCDGLSLKSRVAICPGSELDGHVYNGDCYYNVPINTTATVSCAPGYKEFGKVLEHSNVAQRYVVRCNKDGNWLPSPIRCVPVNHDCGKQDFGAGVSFGGIDGWTVEDFFAFPSQATLYKEKRSEKSTIKMFICGATIIKYDFVMTAAHCVYDEATRKTEDATKLYVMAGNLQRDYDHPKNVRQQRSKVSRVYLPSDYYGLRGNYGSDIALLELKEPFDYDVSVLPACLASTRLIDTPILEKGAIGRVAGFGRTKTEDSSPTLQALKAPYVPPSECQAPTVTAENYVFIMRDKFCAGYTNGTVVCDGDSGGGLLFESKNVSYVMGVVSVSLGVDLSNGEKTCSKHALTVYTKVSEYIDWIEEVIFDPEEESHGTSSRLDKQPPIGRPYACVAPEQPANGQWKIHPRDCTNLDASANCRVAPGAELRIRTTLVYSCDDGYTASGYTDAYCTRWRTWSNLPECVASDPTINRRTPVVQDRVQKEGSEFPWQASMYREKNTPKGIEKQFQCVATMIKANLLLTSRSCVYDRKTNTTLAPTKLFVMAGNIHPDYDSPLHDPKFVRRSRVEVLHVNCTYIREIGNSRALETALLQLEQPLQFTGHLPQPRPKAEGPSNVLRDVDDRRNVSTFKTARGSVVCYNKTVDLVKRNYDNEPCCPQNFSSPFELTKYNLDLRFQPQ